MNINLEKLRERKLLVCRSCKAERKCDEGLAKAALRGEVTCVKCAAKGGVGYFVDPRVYG